MLHQIACKDPLILKFFPKGRGCLPLDSSPGQRSETTFSHQSRTAFYACAYMCCFHKNRIAGGARQEDGEVTI